MGQFEVKMLAVQLANSILSPSALALIHARENATETLMSLQLVNSKEEAEFIVKAVLEGTAEIVQMFDPAKGKEE